MASRSSDWAQHFSGLDGSPVHQLDLLPSWDSEPQFGKDILTQKLWQIFAGNHDKVDQLRHRLTDRQVPDLEGQDPGPCYFGAEPCTEDAWVPKKGAQGQAGHQGMLFCVAQEPAGEPISF